MGRRRKEITIRSEETSIIVGLGIAILALILFLSYFVNAPAFNMIRELFGNSTFILLFISINIALKMFGAKYGWNKNSALFGQFLLFFNLSALGDLLFSQLRPEFLYNGSIGTLMGTIFADIFSRDIATLILLALALIITPLALNISFVSIKGLILFIFRAFHLVGSKFKELFSKDQTTEKPQKNEDEIEFEQDEENPNTMISDLHPDMKSKLTTKVTPAERPAQIVKPVEQKRAPLPNGEEDTGPEGEAQDGEVLLNEVLKYPNWQLPSLDLLDPYKKIKPPIEGIKKNSQIIEQTLQSFGITARVIDAKVGPTVTQYAVNIALGTKVAKIANLKNDLALALATRGDIRIEAPIPGTSYIGIEFANPVSVTVQVKEIMENLVSIHGSLGLGVVMGKAIDGSAIISDIQKMPHLLVAGTTGSGKSVLTNSFITSLLMTKTPDEVKFILIDPKQVEFSDYNGIPHLLTPVIVDIDKVINSLKWAVMEMERRYTVFRQAKVRNLQSYNQMMGFSALPYIVIVIDEMADIMLSLGKDLETCIVKLAQKARATGIHLILATQRPSVDVITGLIKANIPGRVGLKVATQIDSRVILDSIGAESLLGKGDMLLAEPDKAKPQRVQGVWLSQPEVQKVVEYIKSQIVEEEVMYLEEVTASKEVEDVDEGKTAGGGNSSEPSDNLLVESVKIVMSAKKGSASLLQRRLSIGYNRAARLLDEMQELNIVGTQEGSKPREVNMSTAEKYLIDNGSSN